MKTQLKFQKTLLFLIIIFSTSEIYYSQVFDKIPKLLAEKPISDSVLTIEGIYSN